jgi:hypothetical protein
VHALVELVPPEGQRGLPIMREVRRTTVLEIVCVVVVLLAIAALAAWFVFDHGGARGPAAPSPF